MKGEITMDSSNMGFDGLIFLFAILCLFGGGGFGFGNNVANAIGYENMATSNEVQRGFDNQNAMANQREILSAVNSGTAQTVAATNATFHDSLMANQGLYNELARDISGLAVSQANLLANQNECCCSTKQLIMQSNYDAAMRDATTNANFTAQIQSVKDMIAQDKIEALQAEVSKLQLAQATSGMLRFPNSWAYTAGQFPPIISG
ncbi:MAG: hypothetical protein J5725_13135 [Bacteroidales bacterium]|nr:hypothetical protein [Bacteroidales bacterium]